MISLQSGRPVTQVYLGSGRISLLLPFDTLSLAQPSVYYNILCTHASTGGFSFISNLLLLRSENRVHNQHRICHGSHLCTESPPVAACCLFSSGRFLKPLKHQSLPYRQQAATNISWWSWQMPSPCWKPSQTTRNKRRAFWTQSAQEERWLYTERLLTVLSLETSVPINLRRLRPAKANQTIHWPTEKNLSSQPASLLQWSTTTTVTQTRTGHPFPA